MPSSCVRWSARSLSSSSIVLATVSSASWAVVVRTLSSGASSRQALRGRGEVSGGERLQAGELAVEHRVVQHQHVGVGARERAAHARTRCMAAVARRAQDRVLGGVERRLQVGDAAEARGDSAPVFTGVVDLGLLPG